MVLLKNEGGLLPLDREEQPHLVVLGRTAEKTPTGGGGSSYVHRPDSPGILAGLREMYAKSRVDHIPFRKARLSREEKTLIQAADAVILAAGFLPHEESEGFDRPWRLPARQDELIHRVSALNPRTVVVLSVGGGLETESWIHNVPAVLHTFYLGEAAGDAIARVLSGKEEPGGRLPFTIAKRWGDFASTAYYVDRPGKVSLQTLTIGQGDPQKRKVWKMEYGEGLRVGYRHFDAEGIEPQFPFGHGLGYTDFTLGDWQLVEENSQPVVLVTVTNTGQRTGSQVVQGYVHDAQSSVFRPEQELKAFQKARLAPGESRQVGLVFPRSAFQFFDPRRGEWVLEPGVFELRVGTSSREIHYQAEIKVGQDFTFDI
jgi:beta-glucosidase